MEQASKRMKLEKLNYKFYKYFDKHKNSFPPGILSLNKTEIYDEGDRYIIKVIYANKDYKEFILWKNEEYSNENH